MKTEQEIVLQKKMIIIFSLIILIITLGILNIQKRNMRLSLASEEEVSEVEEVTKVYTVYTANEELFKIEKSGEINSEETNIEKFENVEISEQKIVEEKKDDINVVKNEVSTTQEVVKTNISYVRDPNPPPTTYERVIQVKATAYCLCKKCCGKSVDNPRYGYTASGLRIVPGTGMKVIAVDTSIVALGTNVYVEGLNGAWNYGYAVAADTGSAIKNYKIDLYMDTHQQALAWGVKNVNLYILSE